VNNIISEACMKCGINLTARKMYPVYSSRLAVIGYRCEECNEKSKSPAAKKREEEMSNLTKEVPKLENANMDIRRALKNS